jgi:hypothetical protein
MTKSILPLPAFQAVAPGQVASLNVPLGRIYHSIVLRVKHEATPVDMPLADMKTEIEWVKLKIARNGQGQRLRWDVTAAKLVDRNDYYNMPDAAGALGLYFAAPYFNAVGSEDIFRMGTLDVASVVLEVKFASTVVNPSIEAHGLVYDEPNEPLGSFVDLWTTSYGADASAGVREISNLPVTGPGMALKALHIDTDNIDGVELRVNNGEFRTFDMSLNRIVSDIETFRTGPRTWQAGYTHIDLAGNRAAEIMPTAGIRDFRLKLDMSAADAFEILTETVEIVR